MSWQSEITTMVRYLLGDVDDSSYTYSDNRIQTTVLVATQLLLSSVNFSQSYTVSLSGLTLSPDPTDSATQDDNFIALVSLKTACIIVGAEVKSESGNSISIKDGPSAIDLRGVSSTLMALYKDLCVKYDSLMLSYQAGNSIAGQAVLGPYAPGSDFVRRSYSNNDLRGGYFRN